LIGQAVSPGIEGVRNKWFSADNGQGFAATIVPESSSSPHMAKLGDNRYYKRNGESFYVLEHFDLEDMFGRRPKAKLTIRFNIEAAEDGSTKITVLLQNVGRGIAKYVSAIIRFDKVRVVRVDRPLQDVSSANQGSPIVSYVDDHGVLHPGGGALVVGTVFLAKVDDASDSIETVIWLYCENAAPQEIRHLIQL
jgi:hypothetical protein